MPRLRGAHIACRLESGGHPPSRCHASGQSIVNYLLLAHDMPRSCLHKAMCLLCLFCVSTIFIPNNLTLALSPRGEGAGVRSLATCGYSYMPRRDEPCPRMALPYAECLKPLALDVPTKPSGCRDKACLVSVRRKETQHGGKAFLFMQH